MHLDGVDRKLLRLIQDDVTRSVAEVAELANMSSGPTWRRLEKLEAEGVIRGRKIDIDYEKLGYTVLVFLRITLDKTQGNAFDEFISEAKKIPELEAIQTLLGRVDIRMDVRARDLKHYQEIYKSRILALPHITDVEALMLVSEVKNTDRLPI